MLRKYISKHYECLVYIIFTANKKTPVNIVTDKRLIFEVHSGLLSKLVYFERYCDKEKALRKKGFLKPENDSERIKFIGKLNPEMLNIIFTITSSQILSEIKKIHFLKIKNISK